MANPTETLKIDAALETGSWADAVLGPVAAPYTGHGHGERACFWCPEPASCDCPCETCIRCRLRHAGAACAACGSVEGVVERECANCREGREQAEAEAEEAAEPPASYIQAALDRQWASANHGGPGCPFCDSIMGGCRCWEERRELQEAEERRRRKEEQGKIAAAVARGECACALLEEDEDYPVMCDICQREEDLRCRECGKLQCEAGCCGGCGGCSRCRPECTRCGFWEDQCGCYDDRDDASSCGCGACEEHDWRAEDEDDRRERFLESFWQSGH
jgi:hypothetical protein